MKKEKKNILIILSSKIALRNYLRNNVLGLIFKEYNTYILLPENIDIDHSSNQYTLLKKYKYNKFISIAHSLLLDALTWRYRNKSKSFKFRIKRFTNIDLSFNKNENFILKSIKVFWRIILSIQNYFKYFLGIIVIFDFFILFFKVFIKINKNLEESIKFKQFSIIIHPTSAYSPISNDIARISKKNNIPSLFLIDNWDNLSSKSILYFKPNALAVWGEQSKEHAINIQDFEREKIHLIGTARVDHYYKYINKYISSHFNFKYVLFLGTAIKFDEEAAINCLSKIFKKNINLRSYKIVYRPHPWRQSTDILKQDHLDNVIIDPQIKQAYLNLDDSFQPDLKYYPSLIKNAELIVGGLTSMLIESMIFNKKYIALVFDDNKNITSQNHALKNYTHFEGIKNIESLILCNDLLNLETLVKENLNENNIKDMKKYKKILNYYIYSDELGYDERLLNILKQYIKK